MSQEQLPGGKKKSISPSVKPLNISETLSNSKKALNKVRVVHGANEQYFDVVGRSVGSVRKSLRDAMSIPSDAEAIVGGKKVSDDLPNQPFIYNQSKLVGDDWLMVRKWLEIITL